MEDLSGFERRCKPEPVPPCDNSTFGCCPDGFHSAEGPFGAGCQGIQNLAQDFDFSFSFTLKVYVEDNYFIRLIDIEFQ